MFKARVYETIGNFIPADQGLHKFRTGAYFELCTIALTAICMVGVGYGAGEHLAGREISNCLGTGVGPILKPGEILGYMIAGGQNPGYCSAQVPTLP